MRQDPSSDYTKERENEDHSLERPSSMELAEYVFMPDQGMWRGYLKSYPGYQTKGRSFEELQFNLHQLHLDLSGQLPPQSAPTGHCFTGIGNGECPEFRDEGKDYVRW
jgi:hypothetical protein